MKSTCHLAFALSASVVLGGCATASFAPPNVETASKVQRMDLKDCRPQGEAEAAIERDVVGATDLIQNFVYSYRCASAETANGRQVFQVPSFFAAATAAVGATFGLNNDQVLAAGIAAATLNGGQSYYVPQEKTKVIGAALGAVLCVKSEAAGIPYFRTRQDNPPDPPKAKARLENAYAQYDGYSSKAKSARKQRALLDARLASGSDKTVALREIDADIVSLDAMIDASLADLQLASREALAAYGTGGVDLDAEHQYFELVSAALYSIEKILGGRLRDIGTQDLSNVFARYKELQKEADDKKTAATNAADAAQSAAVAALGADPTGRNASEARLAARKANHLSNEELQPNLQICVLQAHDI